jgi:hypothetical protein
MLFAPCSWGDLIDRITILNIKARQMQGEAHANVMRELELLLDAAEREGPDPPELSLITSQLARVNEDLWDAENAIRRLLDGPEYVTVGRLIRMKNDERAALKRRINLLLLSDIVEEKQHG